MRPRVKVIRVKPVQVTKDKKVINFRPTTKQMIKELFTPINYAAL